jgi:hypothetical protein
MYICTSQQPCLSALAAPSQRPVSTKARPGRQAGWLLLCKNQTIKLGWALHTAIHHM